MKRLFIYPVLFCTLLFTACDDENGGGYEMEKYNLVKANIVGARDIVKLIKEYESEIYTVSENGIWTPFTFINNKGETVPFDDPYQYSACHANDKYLLIEGMSLYLNGGSPWPLLLVEKATGAVQYLETPDEYDNIDYHKMFYTDADENIYTISYRDVVKINPKKLTIEKYSNSTHNLYRMIVDRDGICSYSSMMGNNTSGQEVAADGYANIMHPGGTVYTVDELLPDVQGYKYFVLGPDEKTFIVVFLRNPDQTTKCSIYKIDPGQSALSTELVLSQDLTNISYGSFYYNPIRNSLLFFSMTSTDVQIVEFNGTTLTAINKGINYACKSYLTKDALYFYDESTKYTTHVDLRFLNIGWYRTQTDMVEIFYIDADKYSTGLFFKGRRTADNNYIYGTISDDDSIAPFGSAMIEGVCINDFVIQERIKLY